MNTQKIENVFGEYDEYVGWSRKNKEWNTFTHFVRFLNSSKNKGNIEYQKILADLDYLLSAKSVEVGYVDGNMEKHNPLFGSAIIRMKRSHSLFNMCMDYSTLKPFYYSVSIMKYILNNIEINEITKDDFKVLSELINTFKATNQDGLYDDEIKFFTKHKTYKKLQLEHSED